MLFEEYRVVLIKIVYFYDIIISEFINLIERMVFY